MKSSGILLVDANALRPHQVGMMNQTALAFHSAGAFVIFVECVKPNPTALSKGRLRRKGFSYDDLIQLEVEHHEAHDLEVIRFVNKTLENNSDDVVVITGSGIVFQRLLEKGARVYLHG